MRGFGSTDTATAGVAPHWKTRGREAVKKSPLVIDQSRVELIIRKGCRISLDSYSAFFENDHVTATGLDGWLRQRGFRRLYLCGLATDFCVAWSAEDAARLGYDVTIVEDACRAIALPTSDGRTTMDEARDRLAALGVSFVDSSEIVPAG